MRIAISCSPPDQSGIGKIKTKYILKEKILCDFFLDGESIHLEKKIPQYENKVVHP